MEGTRRRFRRAAIFLLLGNMLMGAIPAALAGPGGPLFEQARDTATPPAESIANGYSAPAIPAPSWAATGPVGVAPALAPVPLALSNNTAQNFTPFAPTAFTFGQVGLNPNTDGTNIAALANITVNQTGNLT